MEKDYQREVELNASDFVLVSDYVPAVIQEIRYHSTYNFIGDRIDGYEEPCALLTKEGSESAERRQQQTECTGIPAEGFDAYRPALR